MKSFSVTSRFLLIGLFFVFSNSLSSQNLGFKYSEQENKVEKVDTVEPTENTQASGKIIITALIWLRHIVIFILLVTVGFYVTLICCKMWTNIGFLITPAFAMLIYLSSSHFDVSLTELLLSSIRITNSTIGEYYSFVKVLFYICASFIFSVASKELLRRKKHFLGQLVITSVILLFLSLIDIYVAFLSGDLHLTVSIDTIGFVLGTALYSLLVIDETDVAPITFMHT